MAMAPEERRSYKKAKKLAKAIRKLQAAEALPANHNYKQVRILSATRERYRAALTLSHEGVVIIKRVDQLDALTYVREHLGWDGTVRVKGSDRAEVSVIATEALFHVDEQV